MFEKKYEHKKSPINVAIVNDVWTTQELAVL